MRLSIVIPTYNERDNIVALLSAINSGFEKNKVDGLREILDVEYKLEFACSLDPELNFIYSN